MNKKLLAVVIVIAIILLLSFVGAKISGKLLGKLLKKGVESAIENKIENETGGDVKFNFGSSGGTGSFEMEENGKKTNVDVGTNIPADFPKDIDIYKPSKIGVSSSASDDEGNSISLVLTSADNTKKVYDFYLTSLEKNGWKIASKVESNGGYQIYTTKDVDRSAIIDIGESSGGSSVNITVVLEAK